MNAAPEDARQTPDANRPLQAPTMAARSVIQAAILSLRNAIGNDKKHKVHLNKLRDAFKHVDGDNLSNTELSEHCAHLVQVLSEAIPGLHQSRARPTLVFCGATLSWLFKAKLEPALEKRDTEGATIWEDTIFQGLMQPLLSAVDSEGQDLGDVVDVLYRGICEVMHSSWSESFGGRFARSLALVLVYTCSSPRSKAMLLDSDILGTTALAKLIIDAKDYHHLDTLLELSFTMFSSQGGKLSRSTYADNIFTSEYALKKLPENICNELASIHAVTSGDNSEKHVLDIIRTMSGADIDRPQVFVIQDLSYCGTRYTQRPPNNVMVLDDGAVCVIICDKDKESDVLTVPFTAIQSIDITRQDGSRVFMEFVIAEPPLISSTREGVATPDSHVAGSPLRLRVSIASSDVFGFEAALAARHLAELLNGSIVLTRQSSLASVKISNAVSSVVLKKTNNDQAEELWRKYVNLPSSTCPSPSGPPSAAVAKPTVGAQDGTHKPQVLHKTTTAPAPVPKQPSPKQAAETQEARQELAPSGVVEPPVRPSRQAKRPRPTAAKSSIPPTEGIERDPAPKSTDQVACGGVGGSELTDVNVDGDTTADQPQSRTQPVADSPTQAENAPLPTPPRTRARAQQTKAVARTLVPATPDKDAPVEELSASALPSPSPKPTRKRKHIEDAAIELPPLNPERPAKQTKTDSALTSSQHILPRNTAATRARAKYGATAKRKIASSPPESIHSADTEEVDSTARKNLKVPAREDSVSSPAEEESEEQPKALSRPIKNDVAPRAKRPTRAAALGVKTNPVATKTAKTSARNNPTGSGHMTNSKEQDLSVHEKPKPRRGRPPKNKQKPEQETVEQPSTVNPDTTSVQEQSVGITENVTMVNLEPTPAAEDDLLKRLSQAARKATRTPFVDHQSIQPRPPSPAKNVGLSTKDSHEDEDIDVETIDPPRKVMEPSLSKSTHRQTRTTTVKAAENVSAMGHSGSCSAKEPRPASAPTEAPQETATSGAFVDDHSQTQPPPITTSTKRKTRSDTQASGNRGAQSPVENTGDQIKDASPATHPAAKSPSRKSVPDPAPRASLVNPPGSHAVEEILEIVEPPKTPIQHKPGKTERRIQPTLAQNVNQTPSQRDMTQPKPKDLRHAKSRIAFISIDSTNSDTEMGDIQELAPEKAKRERIHGPSLLATTSPIPSTRQKVPNHQLTPVPEISKARHAAVTRVLFSNQPSPKSALASPQRRTLANGIRPSVSFLDPPVAPLLRRGSSGSSAGAERRKQQEVERERLLEGKSVQTGDKMIQIVDTLNQIQATIMANVGEKVQTVTTEARSARAELTKAVIAELNSLLSESEIHHNALHDLESVFATQAQAILEGFGRIDEFNARIATQAEKNLEKNARAGQGIVGAAVNFQLPEVFAEFWTE